MLKRISFLLTFLFFSSFVLAQQYTSFYSGLAWNKYRDTPNSNGHFRSDYKVNTGFAFGLSLENVTMANKPWRFTFNYSHLSSDIDIYNGGNGAGQNIVGTINRSNIRMGIFPFSFTSPKKIKIALGAHIGAWVATSSNGYKENWRLTIDGREEETIILKRNLVEINDIGMNISLSASFAYDIQIGKALRLSPIFEISRGLTKEFEAWGSKVRSTQLFFGFGLTKSIKEEPKD